MKGQHQTSLVQEILREIAIRVRNDESIYSWDGADGVGVGLRFDTMAFALIGNIYLLRPFGLLCSYSCEDMRKAWSSIANTMHSVKGGSSIVTAEGC